MIENFNIKNDNQNTLYPHHSTYTDILREIADLINLELSMLINQVPTYYANNPNKANSIINLMFLQANSKEFNNHSILPNLQSLSDHTPLTVNIIINEEFIQDKC